MDILVVWIVLNYLIKVVRNSQKTIQLFQGVVLIIIIKAIAELLGLTTVAWLANNVVSWGFLAIIVIFQPEVRSILERIGKSNALARIAVLSSSEKERLIEELIAATANLSASKTGALISLEQSNSLSDYVNTGIRMNSLVSAELICSIFQTTTPLHDGAIIIQGDKLACASAYFPPTTIDLPSKYGARHRAAIGISEITDAFTIVVSEETGRVSVTQDGHLIHMDEKKLREYLNRVILNKEKVQGESRKSVKNDSVSVETLINNGDKEVTFTSGNSETGKEMKDFKTTSFKVVDGKPTEEVSLVKNIINNTLEESGLNKNITIRTISVPKDTITAPAEKKGKEVK